MCDQFSNVIRVIINETVSNFAGVPDIAGYLDGPGDVAEFYYPVAIQIDRRGNLYVSDAGNHVIRKINSSRYVSTFAGVPGVSETVNGPASKAGFSDPHQIHLFKDTETEFMMLVGGYNTGLVKLLCYGQCFNGVYDCYLQQCTCKKGYFGVDCSLKEGYKVSSSTSMFSSTYYTSLITDDSNPVSLITYVSIGVSAMAIIGLVAVGSMSRRNRPKNIPVNDIPSLRSTNSNLQEITVTLQPSKSGNFETCHHKTF